MGMIRLKNVSKFYYSKGIIASGISKVNLDLDVGEFVVITGESGSGKSTLLNVISGLDSYEEGEMYIEGSETSHYTASDFEDYRQKYISCIFQSFNLVSSYTVFQNVALAMQIDGRSPEEIKKKVPEIIEKVGLSAYKNRKVSKLSGGQKQRVAIAGILAMSPDIIIFDEATSMLDPKGKKEIKQLMYDLAGGDDITIISITHDIEEVLQSDDCVVLSKGKLFMHDVPEKVFANAEKLRQIDLDVPFIENVRETFGKYKIKLKANDLKGMVEELCRSGSKR